MFADVHFTLFYTALFNAIQSVILAFFVTHNSDKMWVKTEYQDLHHYVEIREAFEALDKQLHCHISTDAQAAQALPFNMEGLKTLCKMVYETLQHPILSRRHNTLLIQIRFHELKYHFIQAHGLPMTLNVSDYLKRSELHILKKLVHISTFAWLFLTGFVELVYFLMGVIVFVTDGDPGAVGGALTAIYVSVLLFFVLISLMLYNKMKWIFGHIMHMKLISHASTGTSYSAVTSEQVSSQNALFWGGSPKYIINIIQFMQFGYAIFFAILLVFWEDIDAQGPVASYNFFIVLLLTFATFVSIMAHVIPRFTLCSSLGQLVNHRRLHETLARHRLEDARRKRQQQIEEDELYDATAWHDSVSEHPEFQALEADMKNAGTNFNIPSRSTNSNLFFELTKLDTKDLRQILPQETETEKERRIHDRRNLRKSVSEGVSVMRNMIKLPSPSGSGASTPTKATDSSTIHDLGAALRRANRRADRHRSASASASIQMMRDYTKIEHPEQVHHEKVVPITTAARLARRKTASANADIAKMRNTTIEEEESDSTLFLELTQLDTKHLRQNLPEEMVDENMKNKQVEQVYPQKVVALTAAARRVRRKTVSANADISMMRNATIQEETAELGMSDSFFYPELHRLANGKATSTLPMTAGQTKEVALAKQLFPHVVEQVQCTLSTDVVSPRACPGFGEEISMDGKVTIVTENDDDDDSDNENIPKVDDAQRELARAPPPPKPTMMDYIRSYLRHRRYKIVSSVFGTLPCFFMVGMRLERMLIVTGLLVDNDNTWGLDLATSYWVETSLMICFLAVSLGIVYLFRPGQLRDEKDRIVWVTAVVDLIIISVCLTVLTVAESKRCCSDSGSYETTKNQDDGHHRILAGEEKYAEISIPCCPRWGSRAYGGFGNIEPFTSLITLRLIRFHIATKIVQYLDKTAGPLLFGPRSDTSNEPGESERTEDMLVIDPLFDKEIHHEEHHKTHNFEDEKGTVVELWKEALGLYPDIVEKYGEFSAELLQAMLGIEVLETALRPGSVGKLPVASFDRPQKEPSQKASGATTLSALDKPIPPHYRPGSVETQGHRSAVKRPTLTADSRYALLHPEAQSIILAGKVGHNVVAREKSSFEGSLLYGSGSSGVPTDTTAIPAFEVTAEETVEDVELLSQLVAPNARLIRSMRRCDKKLLPMLGMWVTVDVVMTKYEIVYLDTTEVDQIDSLENPTISDQRVQNVREALIATKGGLGLRLRDVAFGRKIVGIQKLDMIESIHVERVLPHDGVFPDDDADRSSGLADEFWKPKGAGDVDSPSKKSRDSRWALLKEDRLKIETKHDTLYLRFYSDLDNMEHNVDRVMSESETEGELFKNNAYQWCQTVARLCGVGQLQQRMPHFGDDSCDELRDYLIVVDMDRIEHRRGPVRIPKRFRRATMIVAEPDSLHIGDHEDNTTPAEIPPSAHLTAVDKDGFDGSKHRKGSALIPKRFRRATTLDTDPHSHCLQICDHEDSTAPAEIPRGSFRRATSFGESFVAANKKDLRPNFHR